MRRNNRQLPNNLSLNFFYSFCFKLFPITESPIEKSLTQTIGQMGEKTALAVIGILISIILLIAGTAVTVNYVQRRRGQQTMGQRIANSVRVKYLLHFTRLRKKYLIVPCQIMQQHCMRARAKIVITII